MRDYCMLLLDKNQAMRAGEYCDAHSTPLPSSVADQLHLTDKLFERESVMAPSPPQCSWLMSFTRALRPARGG